MQERSRREFLKKASSVAAATAVSVRLPAWAQPASKAVRVWSTDGEQRHTQSPSLTWKPTSQSGSITIALEQASTKQEILGFGAAMTDSSCYVLSQLSEQERQPILHDFFAPGEMAMNVCRTCIRASDYARNLYSFDDSPEPDPELKKFTIDHDKAYILPMLREARKLNPDLFLFSSPWSPPGWMKPNKSMLGGAMRKGSFDPYAHYFLKFLEAYKAEGVSIDAVTVQNETDAEQEGRMPACLWAQEQEIEFVKGYLGPEIKKAGLSTKIWVLDHNYSLWGRAEDELSDPAAYEFIDGIAWHGYVGGPTEMTRVHDAFPTKNAYWTEGGPEVTAPDYQTDWAKWTGTFNGILNNWARSITSWNLALDENGKPDIGPFACGGVITVDSSSHKGTRSGQYWAFAHFSRHVCRGAKVFQTAAKPEGDFKTTDAISHVGFINPDGSHVVVVANQGEAARVQLALDSNALDLNLPANSVQTLEW